MGVTAHPGTVERGEQGDGDGAQQEPGATGGGEGVQLSPAKSLLVEVGGFGEELDEVEELANASGRARRPLGGARPVEAGEDAIGKTGDGEAHTATLSCRAMAAGVTGERHRRRSGLRCVGQVWWRALGLALRLVTRRLSGRPRALPSRRLPVAALPTAVWGAMGNRTGGRLSLVASPRKGLLDIDVARWVLPAVGLAAREVLLPRFLPRAIRLERARWHRVDDGSPAEQLALTVWFGEAPPLPWLPAIRARERVPRRLGTAVVGLLAAALAAERRGGWRPPRRRLVPRRLGTGSIDRRRGAEAGRL